jgi:hypothetical protein
LKYGGSKLTSEWFEAEAKKTLEGFGSEIEGTFGNDFEKRKSAFFVMNIAAMFVSLSLCLCLL